MEMQEFIGKLEAAVKNKTEEFNTKILPKVRDDYNTQGSAIQAIRSVLLKRGVIHDDPYKYDSKITEIELPEDSVFPDSEKAGAVGARLAHYQEMLDFLNNYYQFNTNFLTPKKISRLLKFNSAFLWGNISAAATQANTKGLADVAQEIFSGTDKLSASLLRDSFSLMAKSDKNINEKLKELSFLQKEEYKLLVRKTIAGKISVSAAEITNPSKLLKEIKKICLAANKKMPFYTDLVVEMLKEDYGKNKESLQAMVLKKLNPAQKKDESAAKVENYRYFLLTGFKFLGNSAPHFQAALEKIKSNDELIGKRKLSFLQKLGESLKLAFNIPEKPKEIVINIIDPITQSRKKQVINYNEFKTDMSKKTILFANLANPNSPVQQKLKRFDDKTLVSNLTKYISESNELLKQMAGLDEFYKTVKPELRSKIRGIKIEITTITNSLMKANQARAEYTTAMEESEQMKKLGIV